MNVKMKNENVKTVKLRKTLPSTFKAIYIGERLNNIMIYIQTLQKHIVLKVLGDDFLEYFLASAQKY